MEASNPAEKDQKPAEKIVDPAAKDLWAFASTKQSKGKSHAAK